jgi:hypothetical protein
MEKGFAYSLTCKIVDGKFFDNMISNIMWSLVEFKGMTKTTMAHKLMCFGAYGVTIFQGVKMGVII